MFIHRLSVDDSREEKEEEEEEEEELCVPCNSATHLFPLLWGYYIRLMYYIRLIALGVLYKTFLKI